MNYVKTPPPRPLSKQETLDSLNHWKNLFRNYYRRDSSYKQFLKKDCTWDFSSVNYALTDSEQEPASERAENLSDFLGTLAGFLPHSYLTQKILEDSKCLQDCWDLIYEHYNVQVTPATLLDFDSLKKEPTENYRQFYERLLQHVRLHLAPAGAKVENMTNTNADKLTISLMNIVAMTWLRKCNPDLIEIIKKEYSSELRSGEQLASLVPLIAPNIDSLVSRYTSSNVGMISQRPEEVIIQHTQQTRQTKSNAKKLTNKGKTRQNFNKQSVFFCPGCYAVSKELMVGIDYKHKASMCPRTSAVSRFLLAQDSTDTEDTGETGDESEADQNGNTTNSTIASITSSSFQINNLTSNLREGEPILDRKPCQNLKIQTSLTPNDDCHIIDRTPHNVNTHFNISDDEYTMNFSLNKIEERKHLWSTESIRKESSPRIRASLNNIPFDPVIDEGSEVTCVSDKFADLAHIDYMPTKFAASSANSTHMKVMGQTSGNVVIAIAHEKPIVWDLGRCIVVKNLSVDMLIGEPGKKDNKIVTIPYLKRIKTEDINGNVTFIDYSTKSNASRHICKLKIRTTLFQGEQLRYRLPRELEDETEIAINQVKGTTIPWIEPQVLSVKDGFIDIYNNTPHPVVIHKNTEFADLVKLNKVNLQQFVANKVIADTEDSAHFERPDILKKKISYINEVSIDPDKQLSVGWRDKFKSLCIEYSDTINPNPGRYNGYFGNVDNSIDFLSTPPPSVKARLPQYSSEKLKIMGKLMDDLENMGVLAKPEDMGVAPAFVVPSLLTPKPEKGEWRLVSDFTPLNIHIRKFQTISPTIQDAKKAIAKYKYNIECDLSHYFFQGGMRKEDIQYLATPHPFKGLRVYCVEPQGLRNASEHSYERLARIFGDLCMQEKMTRMADGLFILADTVSDLYENFRTVLERAKKAGLTFKPKKIIIAPKETVLFGWRKSNDGWHPTEHTVSPLTLAEEPSTVKQMRSYLGSYKQLTECISDYAVLLHPLEQLVAGKDSAEKIVWNKELSDAFVKVKESLKDIKTIFVAKPTDKLDIFTDYSESSKAIGGRLLITREEEDGSVRKLLGGHFSCRLTSHQKK